MRADAESSCTESRTDSWSQDGARNPWSAPTTELWAPTPAWVVWGFEDERDLDSFGDGLGEAGGELGDVSGGEGHEGKASGCVGDLVLRAQRASSADPRLLFGVLPSSRRNSHEDSQRLGILGNQGSRLLFEMPQPLHFREAKREALYSICGLSPFRPVAKLEIVQMRLGAQSAVPDCKFLRYKGGTVFRRERGSPLDVPPRGRPPQILGRFLTETVCGLPKPVQFRVFVVCASHIEHMPQKESRHGAKKPRQRCSAGSPKRGQQMSAVRQGPAEAHIRERQQGNCHGTPEGGNAEGRQFTVAVEHLGWRSGAPDRRAESERHSEGNGAHR